MFGIENYMLFVISGLLLNLTPGADTVYIIARTVSQGRKAGIISVLGISSGAMTHTLLASFGLSAVLASSAAVFNALKITGALYLVYLGVRALFSVQPDAGNLTVTASSPDYFRVYKQGYLTNLFNPKVGLFFLSFLPQFIDPAAGKGPLPFLILGCTFLFTGTLWCLVLAFAASGISGKLTGGSMSGRYLQKISGIVFIGLGLKIALSGRQ